MIKLLRIKNIAVVASVEVEFGPGLNLLTGETGAGKSILVDALGLLLGERASAELVRTGESQASVEAVLDSPGLALALEARGLPASDADELIVRRELSATGKGRASLNGALVPLSTLRELVSAAVEIHGQNQQRGLLDPDSHLDLLDRHAGVEADAASVAQRYAALRGFEAELRAFVRDRREIERRREMLEFQAREIEEARLEPGEEESLRRDKAVQSNAGRLAALCSEAYGALYEDEQAALARLRQAYRRVEELAEIEPAFRVHLDGREAVLAAVEDLALALRDFQGRLTVTPGRLDAIEARLSVIERLTRKYGASLADVVAFGSRCRSELDLLASPEERFAALDRQHREARAAYLETALEVSRRRRLAARELERLLVRELGQLAMEKARFRVAFAPETPRTEDDAAFHARGLERAEFLFSPNLGEELRPLTRVASGGELSRVLLALESVASGHAAPQTLVFDEVDAGIGGRVAEVVGRRLRALARRHQVLCVTHLPQIAALAHCHFAVRKKVEAGRTLTRVEALGAGERIEEVARMLAGEMVTESARQHAREMVRLGLES